MPKIETSEPHTMTFEEWWNSDFIAAITVDEPQTIVILPRGDDELPWACMNITNNVAWCSDSRMLRVMFKDATVRPVTIQ